jgi:acyl-[acyl-carrier-protein]-phospholipid O-acyltransferase/long-chain-fatty-acid--[acyl-carrier-protein] ligase
MKTLFRFLLRLVFRFRAYNEAALNVPGPVLLLPNHTALIDWLFLGLCLEDDWKFVVSSVTAQTSWVHRKIMLNSRTFPIDTASPYSLKHMAEFLESGGRLVLFAEGRLTRTGSLMKLFDGTGFLLHKTRAKVITCHVRGPDRLPQKLTMNRNLKQWFPRITVHFNDALTPPKLEHVSTAQARATLTNWLRDQMISHRFAIEMQQEPATILAAVAERARLGPRFVVMEDATRQALTYRRLMVGVDLMARQLRPFFNATPGERVGVLLPNFNATPVVLLGLWAASKVPAVLNFSTGTATMLACAQLAGLKQIITSRTFLQRAKLNVDPFVKAGIELIYLEETRKNISDSQKFLTLLRHKIHAPRFVALARPDDTAVVLFTSGSEGMPKGVELTHANLIANIRQLMVITDIQDNDRVFNALPLFHSFGLSIGTLLPLVRGIYVFIYPSPLHYRVVPTVFYDRDCTIMIGTNTFLNGYARKAHPYDFRSLRYMFAGAEKVQEATANLWARRFGVRILEGYGATECGPCVSLTTPMEAKHGAAGRLLPGIEYKLEPVEGVSEGGRLLVRGPNVMKGYLNPDANEKFKALGGWYDTGDIASVDADRYVTILGRLKRFAKVSGEMVSLTAVEDALAGAFPKYGLRCQIAVLSRPDEDKGEMLVAVTNEKRLTLDEIRAAIKAKGLANLCVPREIKVVKEIPKLGTGKVNHRELAKIV